VGFCQATPTGPLAAEMMSDLRLEYSAIRLKEMRSSIRMGNRTVCSYKILAKEFLKHSELARVYKRAPAFGVQALSTGPFELDFFRELI
jgi:hypothetical protein